MKEFHFATTGLGTTGVLSVQAFVIGVLFATTGFEGLGSVQGVPFCDFLTVAPGREKLGALIQTLQVPMQLVL